MPPIVCSDCQWAGQATAHGRKVNTALVKMADGRYVHMNKSVCDAIAKKKEADERRTVGG